MTIMCAPAVRERSSAWLRLARIGLLELGEHRRANWRGAMLIST
jgi:hypothetical protein